MEKGCVHIYTGGGKGKTTAATGLAVRAVGAGMKVVFAQFLKGMPTGETGPLTKLGVTVLRSENVTKFIPDMNAQELEECRAAQQKCLERAKSLMGTCGMLVLDEIIAAVNTGMLSEDEVAGLISSRPEHLEIILTGRDPSKRLLDLADYISEIKAVRHPYDRGITARKGIEF